MGETVSNSHQLKGTPSHRVATYPSGLIQSLRQPLPNFAAISLFHLDSGRLTADSDHLLGPVVENFDPKVNVAHPDHILPGRTRRGVLARSETLFKLGLPFPRLGEIPDYPPLILQNQLGVGVSNLIECVIDHDLQIW